MRPVDIFADSTFIRPLLSGLSLRLRFQIELWNDRFLADGLVHRSGWSLILFQEPLSGQFNLTRSWDPDNDEWLATLDEVTAALERWYQAPRTGPKPGSGTYYYEARLEVEVLSLGDLEELEHWLKGEVAAEDTDVGSALGRGIKRLFIRVIGLASRTFQARTEPFHP